MDKHPGQETQMRLQDAVVKAKEARMEMEQSAGTIRVHVAVERSSKGAAAGCEGHFVHCNIGMLYSIHESVGLAGGSRI